MEYVVSIICIVAAFLILGLIAFLRMKGNVKEWLIWAVSEAENYLGSGTGELKLRYVYGIAVEKFPIIKYLVPFDVFSLWVDEALAFMKEQIENNPNIKNFTSGCLIDNVSSIQGE